MAATEIERAYAAGLIDGEGCIDIGYNKKSIYNTYGQFYPRVTVHITDKSVLDWLMGLWGGSIFIRKTGLPHWKQSYDWKLQSVKALDFITDIKPYLIIKSDQAEAFLKFNTTVRGTKVTDTERDMRLNIMNELKELKKGTTQWLPL